MNKKTFIQEGRCTLAKKLKANIISGVAYLLTVLIENVKKLFVQFTKLLYIAVNSQK